MSKTKRMRLPCLILSLLLALSLGACAGSPTADQSSAEAPPPSTAAESAEAAQSGAPADDAVALTFWVTETLVTPSEKMNPPEQWYLTQAIERFQKTNPNVTIDLTLQNDSAQTAQLLKAASMAGTAPDMASMWTGNHVLGIKEILLPLGDKLPDDVREHVGGWEAVSENFDENATPYAFPICTQDEAFFFYNKSLVAQAGLDFENNPPRTMSEFFTALDAIKEAGIVPIVTNEGKDHGLIYFIFTYWWVQQTGIDGITASNVGQTKFADDAGLIRSLETYQQLYSGGYLNEDVLSADDFESRFLRGEAAMLPRGSWRLADYLEALGDDLGILKPPNIEGVELKYDDGLIGGPGECMVICKDTQYPDTCVDFLSALVSKEEFKEFCKVNIRLPNRNDIDVEELGLADTVTPKMFDWAGDVIFFVDNIVEVNAMQELVRLSQDVLVGKMDPKACAEAMDRMVQDNL